MRQALGIGVVMAMLVTPAMASFFDNFDSYATGALGGQDGWTGTTTGAIEVVNDQSASSPNSVKFIGGSGNVNADNNFTPDETGVGGVITVGFKIQAGSGESTLWYVDFLDTAGASMGRFYGTGTAIRGRMGGTGQVTDNPAVPLSGPGIWDNAKIVINTVTNYSYFYLNDSLLPGNYIGNPLPHSATGCGDVLGAVQMQRISNVAGDYLWIDDLYTPEPATLALLALGALFVGRRRVRA